MTLLTTTEDRTTASDLDDEYTGLTEDYGSEELDALIRRLLVDSQPSSTAFCAPDTTVEQAHNAVIDRACF